LDRRTFLTGTAATAAGAVATGFPAIVQAESKRVLKFVPEADVVIYDPVVTPAWQTRDHAYLVYDTLFGVDDNFRPHPQMVEGFVVEKDGLLWKFTLREGLKFHDGEPVLARDAAASIRRWAVRDSFGQALAAATNEIVATSDRVFEIRLKQPFPLLPDALGKPMAYLCPVMPERLAKTDPYKPIKEVIGSGPYKYVKDERVPGSRIVYERFAGYVPRKDGVTQFTAGPKIAHFDRIEWSIIQDSATAAAALERGEIDWLQKPNVDLLPRLRRNKDIVIRSITPMGLIAYMRFNHLHPPFDNPAIRRAIIGAVKQSDYMIAVNGVDKALWNDGVGYFVPQSPLASKAGMERLTGPRDLSKVRKELKAAGYKGEKVAMMVAVDVPYLKIMGDVTADLFKKIGLNVDYQAIDWTTLAQRRAKMDPPSKGGWSLFAIYDNGTNEVNPAGHLILRGNGKKAAFGWPTSAKLESLRDDWFRAKSLDEQKKIAVKMQLQAFQDVPYIPLGQAVPQTGYRMSLTGVLTGQPVFWNVRRKS
jgi:peptide/nickel transport system substrate-binding protein